MGHNIIVDNAEFSVDGITCQIFDGTWLDIHRQFFAEKSPGFIEQHERNIGNRPELVKWQSDLLPGTSLLISQPWFYSESGSNAFPLHLNGESSRSIHSYTFNGDLWSLLRVKVLVGDQWYHATNPMKYLTCLLDGGRKPTTVIPTPKLYAHYAVCSDDQLDHYRSKSYTRFIRGSESIRAEKSSKAGTRSAVDIVGSNYCQAIFWLACNEEASRYNNHSDYGTNTHSSGHVADSGQTTPIRSASLKTPTGYHFREISCHHFCSNAGLSKFPSVPREVGYHGLSFSRSLTSGNCDNGIIPERQRYSLICHYKTNSCDEDSNGDNIGDEAAISANHETSYPIPIEPRSTCSR